MNEKELRSSDIVLAATLSTCGYKPFRIDVEGTKGFFVFENVPQDLVARFYLRDLTVEPQAFNAAIRSLTTAVRRMINM